jgi:hypothetical protein
MIAFHSTTIGWEPTTQEAPNERLHYNWVYYRLEVVDVEICWSGYLPTWLFITAMESLTEKGNFLTTQKLVTYEAIPQSISTKCSNKTFRADLRDGR